ncbi:MAG: DUF4835 family protein [Cyclobacteriaceae bacterium]
MRRFGLTIFTVVITTVIGLSQELNCRVIIDAQQVQSTERDIFDEMEIAFAQFLNDRKWTEDNFENDERINCNLIINISSMPTISNFEASVQILSARPVYESNYESILLNFGDRDWTFEYAPSQPLNYNDNAFNNNITSLLAFYAYVIIGLDYDSFESMAGQPYMERAWQVVNNAQQSGFAGWNQFGSIRNRYWLGENLINQQMEPLRESIYSYHRQGMDLMQTDPEKARTTILEGLKKMQQVNNTRPRAILTTSYLDAKTDELANVFSQGNNTVRRNAYNIITQIDPSKAEALKKMIEN